MRDRRRLVGHRRRQGPARALHPVRLLRGVGPGRRQLGVRQPQRHVGRLPRPVHQRLARAHGLLGLPDARPPIPTSPTTRTSREYFDDYVDHFGLRERITFETAVERADAAPGRLLGDRRSTRRDPRLRRAARRQRPPLGPALARTGVPRRRHVLRRSAARALLRRQLDLRRQATSSSSAWATPRWTSRSSPPTSPRSTYLAARQGAWIIPKYVFGKPVDQLPNDPRVPFKIRQRMIQQADQARYTGDARALRPAQARPQVRRGAPDRLRAHPRPHRARHDHAEAEHRRARRVARCASPTAATRRRRRRRLLHRLQDHVPVLRRGLHRPRPTTTSSCSGASSTPTFPTSTSSACCSRSGAIMPLAEAQGAVGRPTTCCGDYVLPVAPGAARRHRRRPGRDAQALRRLQAPHDPGRLRRLPLRDLAKERRRAPSGARTASPTGACPPSAGTTASSSAARSAARRWRRPRRAGAGGGSPRSGAGRRSAPAARARLGGASARAGVEARAGGRGRARPPRGPRRGRRLPQRARARPARFGATPLRLAEEIAFSSGRLLRLRRPRRQTSTTRFALLAGEGDARARDLGLLSDRLSVSAARRR